jgi:hypothetical protein
MGCIHQSLQWLPYCAHSTASDHGGNYMNNWATASFSTNRIHVVAVTEMWCNSGTLYFPFGAFIFINYYN